MTFYVFNGPPNCCSDLLTIEDIILTRYKHIVNISGNSDERDSNLIQTEEFDNCSQFFLTLIASVYTQLKRRICSGEKELFLKRLNVLNREVIISNIKSTLSFLKVNHHNTVNADIKLIKRILTTVISRSDHVLNKQHSSVCRKINILVPFTFPLDLVRRREVEIIKGKCKIPCCKWNLLLGVVFQYLYNLQVEVISSSEIVQNILYCTEDDRIRQLIARFGNYFVPELSPSHQIIRADDINYESQYFPPCMANLHQVLRKSHRLSYESRYHYTTYLKLIGVPLEENLKFWEEEYRKSAAGSECCHDWEGKGKRYTYQIKHLYGEIGTHGGRQDPHDCLKFIDAVGFRDIGCPFQHLDEQELKDSLPIALGEIEDIEDLFTFKSAADPQKCCAVYLKCQQKLSTGRRGISQQYKHITSIETPVQFYQLAKLI